MEHYLFRRRYVWQLPVRLFHWLNALCMTLLIATGYLIGDPPGLGHAGEAYQQSWFGWVRFIHFAAAWVCVLNFAYRLFWSLVGNRYSRWRQFIPTSRRRWREILEVLRIDILQTEPGRLPLPLGHNALAGLSYFVFLLVFVFQLATGFALYAPMSDSWFPGLFTWLTPVFGSEFTLRTWHHVGMWFFVLFTLVHVHLVAYHDYVEGRGTTSAIVGGWKFARPEELEHEEP